MLSAHPAVFEPRTKLGESAKRAGWQGFVYDLHELPSVAVQQVYPAQSRAGSGYLNTVRDRFSHSATRPAVSRPQRGARRDGGGGRGLRGRRHGPSQRSDSEAYHL
jgi:hypothetical protein